MGFSRQEHWNGLRSPSPGGLPNPGIEPMSLMSPAPAGRLFTTSATWEALRKQQSCLQKWAPDQDAHSCRSRHRSRHASSAQGCKATRVQVLDPCLVGDQPDRLSWADLENIARGGGVFWGEHEHPAASSHRHGLPEGEGPPSRGPKVPLGAPWHIHLPPPSVDTGVSSPGTLLRVMRSGSGRWCGPKMGGPGISELSLGATWLPPRLRKPGPHGSGPVGTYLSAPLALLLLHSPPSGPGRC